MATKTQKPEGAAAPELVPIDKLREQHKVGRATYAGVCAANGWRTTFAAHAMKCGPVRR